MPEPAEPFVTLQCAEVWGGVGPADVWLSVPGLDVRIISRPYGGQGGGDIHLVSLCNRGQLSRFVVADVAGHGPSVQTLADRVRGLMAEHADTPDQTQFIQQLNHALMDLGRRGQFTTALTATYLLSHRHLLLCNAGHPRPLRYNHRRRRWHLLDHTVPDSAETLANLPLGVVEQTQYQQFAVPLHEGDMVLLYTDSLIEAARPDGEPLGEQGLIDLARRLDPDDPAHLPEQLLSAVADYRHQPPQDDVTLLALHHHGRGPST